MSLRARLTIYFGIIVVLPVTAVTAYGWKAVARSTAPDELLRPLTRHSTKPSSRGGTGW